VARRRWTREALVEGVRAGDHKALARAITLVESRDELADDVLRELFPHTGRARLIGVTGSPGAGKSSLIGALIRHVRGLDLTVGVVSVDPSSPFTSGALLGDRIRLADHFLDPDVFIRSMGTRGHLGGLAQATLQAALLLDAAGKQVIFLETVGTGQSEVEVIGIADTVLLVLMPGSGDAVQALKAGIMEIPDVIAVNKMDQPAAKATFGDVRSVIALDPEVSRRPEVLFTDALRGEGVPELWTALERRRGELAADGRLDERRRRNLAGEVVAVATSRLRERLELMVGGDAEARALIEAVQQRDLDPLTAVERLLESMRDGSPATDAR
jgi:LAO/AO transport system kinase